ncbi:MAG: hypothetical protein JXA17_01875 [Dehalococcoidales bacterium]|nr:hypothetical protein [Dehalococcoidales bacterium]
MDSLSTFDWIAALALVMSLITVFFQLRFYLFRVRLRILDYIVPYVHGRLSLAVVRLAIVNPSSKAISVCNINIISSLKDVPAKQVVVEYSEDFLTSYYKLANDETEYRFQMPTSELLRTPLDILPHQSVSKWIVFSLELPEWIMERDERTLVTMLDFVVYDHRYDVWKQRGKIAHGWKQALVGRKFSASWPYT